jgi:hypothetical protein
VVTLGFQAGFTIFVGWMRLDPVILAFVPELFSDLNVNSMLALLLSGNATILNRI